MIAEVESAKGKLSDYEAEQVRQIAAWKSEPTNPISEIWNYLMMPGVRFFERILPDPAVRTWIEKSYDIAEKIDGREEIKRQAGVQELNDLRSRPLEDCDRMATRVGRWAAGLAVTEGAATGAGGVLTTLLDIPLLFVLSMRTIPRIGHCYGYSLDQPKDRQYVLGVLLIALGRSLHVRRRRLDRLRELEEMLLQEMQEEIIAEEALSLLFQLEIFEQVPGIGAVSGAWLNLAYIRRVDVAARRVFQERWLHDNGKVAFIEPAAAPDFHVAAGLSGALGRAAYYLSFGAALPVYLAGAAFRPADHALVAGR